MTRLDRYLEWVATAVLLSSIALTSFNVFPLNIYLSFTGNAVWIVVAWYWKKWSLFSMSAVICAIYAVGMIKHWFF